MSLNESKLESDRKAQSRSRPRTASSVPNWPRKSKVLLGKSTINSKPTGRRRGTDWGGSGSLPTSSANSSPVIARKLRQGDGRHGSNMMRVNVKAHAQYFDESPASARSGLIRKQKSGTKKVVKKQQQQQQPPPQLPPELGPVATATSIPRVDSLAKSQLWSMTEEAEEAEEETNGRCLLRLAVDMV